ncbi:MAG: 5-methyltetrahydrofolate corrinoid/iron sulfur protein methyltransferase [Halanaerobiales bacterium]|nr:5-methyltetrahydrofolate corrinoid/iron sulfur protein methyltransferase [Halanaerobiales bacterium]
MIIIGELINSTRKEIKKAIEEKDKEYIQDIAQKQVEKGADFIDVNAGAFVHEEVEYLEWLVKIVQEVIDKPLALDSPNPEALKKALEFHEGTPMINSITAEKERYQQILPLVKEYNARVIALCMDDEGMPETAEERLKVADKLINNLDKDGIPLENVFLDPLIKPISVNGEFGPQVLDTISGITEWGTDVHITCGLSNISYGLPKRALLNQAFLVLAMGRGLDSAIIDPLDDYLMKLVKASEVLLNLDPFGSKYLKAARAGELD